MLTDGRTHGRTDDGRKVITIAHPEQSSGELKMNQQGPSDMRVMKAEEIIDAGGKVSFQN